MTYEKNQQQQQQSMNNSQPIQTTNYTPQQNTGNFMTELTNTPSDWSQFIIQFGWGKNQPIEYVYQTNGGRDWLLKMVSEAESGQLNSSEGVAQYPMIKAFYIRKENYNMSSKFNFLKQDLTAMTQDKDFFV